MLAIIEHAQGNSTEARRLLQESIAVLEHLGDRQGRAACLHQLATIEAAQGNPTEARRLLQESIAVDEDLGDRQGRAASLHKLAGLDLAEGDVAAASERLRESARLNQELGDLNGVAHCNLALGQLAFARGEREAGMDLVREAHALFQQLGSPNARETEQLLRAMRDGRLTGSRTPDPLETALGEADDALTAGDATRAEAAARRALELAVAADRGEPEARFLLARALIASNCRDEAVPHLERSEALLRAAGRDDDAAIVRTVLEDDDDDAPAEQISPEDAIAEADTALARPDLPPQERLQLQSVRAQALLALHRLDEAEVAIASALRDAASIGHREALAFFESLRGAVETRPEIARLLATPLETLHAAPPAERAAGLARRALALAISDRPDDARALLADIEAALPAAVPPAHVTALLALAQTLAALGDRDRARAHLAAAERLAARELPQALSAVLQLKNALDARR